MIGYATSSDGVSWTKYNANPVLIPGGNGGWDNWALSIFTVVFNGTHYEMWYGAQSFRDVPGRIGVAVSVDGINWTKYPNNPILGYGPGWDSTWMSCPSVVMNGSQYAMWYNAQNSVSGLQSIGLATSSDGFSWTKYGQSPVLEPGPSGSWDSQSVQEPNVLRVGASLLMYYIGNNGTFDSIGLASAPAYPLFDVTWGRGTIKDPASPYYVSISYDHTVTSFDVNRTGKLLSFNITADGSGICNVTIPRIRFDSPFDVAIDGNSALFSMNQNASYSTLVFAYTSGTHSIKITFTELGHIIGDLNGDGQVGLADLVIIALNYGSKEADYP